MGNGLTRLTEPLVRDNGSLRAATWDEALDRAAAGLRSATERNGGDGVGLFSCSKSTNEMNFVSRSSCGRCFAATTSTAATALDTLHRSSVWRRCSEREAGQVHTRRSSTPTSSCCGGRSA